MLYSATDRDPAAAPSVNGKRQSERQLLFLQKKTKKKTKRGRSGCFFPFVSISSTSSYLPPSFSHSLSFLSTLLHKDKTAASSRGRDVYSASFCVRPYAVLSSLCIEERPKIYSEECYQYPGNDLSPISNKHCVVVGAACTSMFRENGSTSCGATNVSLGGQMVTSQYRSSNELSLK